MTSTTLVAALLLVMNASCSLGAEEKEMRTSPNPEQFSAKEIVDYECVKTVDAKSVGLLCSALKEHLLKKGALAKSHNDQLADGIHIRLSLETVTDHVISGGMEWTRCKEEKCGSWTKTGVIQTVMMDSEVRPSTYQEFIIGLFIHAEKSAQIDQK